MRLWINLVVSVLLASGVVKAQDAPIHTLRVFTNLIQIPTLVLDESGAPVDERTKPKFVVSLDGGKPFAASHVRLEGEDPISLAVVMDASGSQNELLREMSYALPALAASGNLRAHDHVTIYAVDCATVKTLDDGPADRLTLRVGVESALKSPLLHGGKIHGVCVNKVSLREVLSSAAQALAQLPGRRVIVAMTNGLDADTMTNYTNVRTAMQHYGTTVFGMSLVNRSTTTQAGRGQPLMLGPGSAAYDPEFDAMCQTSGGLVLTADDTTLKEKLALMTRLLRARYIVQFPRADDLSGGVHELLVSVAGKKYLIRSAGASMPTADPKLKDDPTVLRVPKEVPVVAEPTHHEGAVMNGPPII